MKKLVVSYDLFAPETRNDYRRLTAYFQSYGQLAYKAQFSFWILETWKAAAQVRDEVKALLDANDTLFVFEITNSDWASFNISAPITTWLKAA